MADKPAHEELERKVKALEKKLSELTSTERALQESKALYRAIVGAFDGLIYICSPDYRIEFMNDKFIERTGYDPTGDLCYKALHDLDSKCPWCVNEKVFKGETVRWEVKSPKDDRWYYVVNTPIHHADGTISKQSMIMDITERKLNEKSIRLNEERLEGLLNLSQMKAVSDQEITDFALEEGVRLTGSKVGYLHFFKEDQNALELYSWSKDALKECTAEKTAHYPLNEAGVWADCVRSRKPVIHNDYENLTNKKGFPEGHFQVIRHMSVPVFEGDQIVAVSGVGNKAEPYDDTDVRQLSLFMNNMWRILQQRRSEAALRESERKYRELAESLPQVIFETDEKGNFTFVNQNALDLFGYIKDELNQGLNAFKMLIPEDRIKAKDNFTRVLKGETIGDIEYTALAKDGTTFPVLIHSNRILENDRPAGLRGFLIDITERVRAEEEKKKLESKLYQAQKMESIGTLAGGIAHNFNNFLMGIQGNTSLMLLDCDGNHPHYDKLKHIETYVQRSVDLTNQLLGLARGGKYEMKPTNINQLIQKSSEIFERTIKEITIHRKYEDHLWSVEVDRGQIEQVLLNLFVNAWQAMPGRGDLYLTTQNIFLDEDSVRPYNVKPGKYVMISVTDTGKGMDSTTQERIFDPFFTTKDQESGTGLGLASAYGIIKNHAGIINVYSEVDIGTTFNIYLPASAKQPQEVKETSTRIRSGKETILLIDDEKIVLDVGQQMLTRLGYTALVAANGEVAVEFFQKEHENIDLIILDMIMPKFSGGETFDKLKEINPNVKVILSSGYSINGQANEILSRGCHGFIQKPFNLEQLSLKIRKVLDE